MTEIAKILMKRDGLTEAEALEVEKETREAVREAIENGEDPEEVLMDLCGLEPDYLDELLDW